MALGSPILKRQKQEKSSNEEKELSLRWISLRSNNICFYFIKKNGCILKVDTT